MRPSSQAKRLPFLGLSSKVVEARAECDKLLAEMAIEYELLPPIRRGICGTPAPILVKSIGSDPKVTIVAAGHHQLHSWRLALNDWLKEKVQPEAMNDLRHAGGETAQRCLLCLPQPQQQSERRSERTRARQCARHFRVHA